VKTIKKLVDRMAVILPFEEDFYREHGFAVGYVGHPLVDTVRASMSRPDFLRSIKVAPDSTVIGLLPGSRKGEVAAMLPVFLACAALLREQVEKPVFVLPMAPTLAKDDLMAAGLAEAGIEVRVIREKRYDLMAACDVVMAASGTVSLELAILNVPMVIAYRLSPLTYLLGKLLVKVRYASLVNLVAGREVVPELLQDQATPERIAKTVLEVLNDKASRAKMLAGLAEVCGSLGEPGASDRAARMALAFVCEGI